MATLTRSMTYAELVIAINTSALHKGESITITDFATTHYMIDGKGNIILDDITPVINTGTIEPLTVLAISNNTIDCVAKSQLYPQDIIYYDWNPINWITDISFSIDELVIITQFKGVIYFRHDTYLNNKMGYDFRNVKFRRWGTGVLNYSDTTTYGINDFCRDSLYIYKSKKETNLNNPVSDSLSWFRLVNIEAEYIISCIDGTILNFTLPKGLNYNDYLTFNCNDEINYNNHFINNNKIKIGAYGNINTILPNNVFIDWGEGIYDNTFEGYSYNNTFTGLTVKGNNVGNCFVGNVIHRCFDNYLGNFFMYNIFNLVADSKFNSATSNNIFNADSDAFFGNIVNNNFSYNQSDFSFNANIGNSISGFIFYNNVQYKTFNANAQGSALDLSESTILYSNYSAEILLNQDSLVCIRYCNSSLETITVLITA